MVFSRWALEGIKPVAVGNGIATAGFVCGLVAALFGVVPFFFVFAWILGPLGVILGLIGRSRVSRGEASTGKGMGTAGAILGAVGIVLGIVWILVIGSLFHTIDRNLVIHDGDFDITVQSCTTRAGQSTATGTITNRSRDDKVFVTVHVDFRDRKGTTIGSGSDVVGSVASGESASFRAVDGQGGTSTLENVTCDASVG